MDKKDLTRPQAMSILKVMGISVVTSLITAAIFNRTAIGNSVKKAVEGK